MLRTDERLASLLEHTRRMYWKELWQAAGLRERGGYEDSAKAHEDTAAAHLYALQRINRNPGVRPDCYTWTPTRKD